MKKRVYIDKRANKEINSFPLVVREEFDSLIDELSEFGYLLEPFAKKLKGIDNLFEMIVKYKGQYRVLYGYLGDKEVIVLHAFQK